MQAKFKTAFATALSSAVLVGGGVVAASPAHAVSSYLITTSTLSSCQAELRYAVKDLQASGQLHSTENCGKRKTNNHGGYVYQGTVYYTA